MFFKLSRQERPDLLFIDRLEFTIMRGVPAACIFRNSVSDIKRGVNNE
jgi:hypothetical protein